MSTYATCPVCKLRMSCSAEAQILRCDRCQHIFERTEPEVLTVLPASAPSEPIPVVLPANQEAHRVGLVKARSSEGILWWECNLVEGLTTQPGVAVLRREFVAFIPKERAKNLVGGLVG